MQHTTANKQGETDILVRMTTTTTLLPASLQKALQGIVERANLRGAVLRAILLSTTEGVPLGRVVVDGDNDNHNTTTLNEEVLASIESVWAPASKQFPVLGLDKVQQVTAIYDHGTLVHVYQAPLVRKDVGAGVGVIVGVGVEQFVAMQRKENCRAAQW